MSAFKGTPGPWVVGQNMADHIYAGINPVAEVFGIPQDTPREEVTEQHAEGLADAAAIAQVPAMVDELVAIESSLGFAEWATPQDAEKILQGLIERHYPKLRDMVAALRESGAIS